MDSVISARDRIRKLRNRNALGSNGATVCIRGGKYHLEGGLIFQPLDNGSASGPIVYQNYPGEKVILTGGQTLKSEWFSPVTSSDSVWSRLDASARNSIVKVNLGEHGVSDMGLLEKRGINRHSVSSPMELSVNNEMMHLARWPNKGQNDQSIASHPAQVKGNLNPNVTGTYEHIGNTATGDADDGYPNYRRQGLVGGVQYYLYHCTWADEQLLAKFWFISASNPKTEANCWPDGSTSAHSSWTKATPEEGLPPLEPLNSASGTAVVHLHPEDFSEHGFITVPEQVSGNVLPLPGTRHTRWTQADDIWVQGLFEHYYASHSVPAVLNNSNLTLATDPGFKINAKMPFFVFNLLEEIDTPGEYYLDRKSKILYLYPPSVLANTQVSMLDEPLIAGFNVEHIQFKGLTLEMVRGDLVLFSKSNNIFFERMVLRNNGGTGISLSGSNNKIEKSHIYNNGAQGVYLQGGSRPTLVAGNNVVKNCDIHDFARWDRSYKPGVFLSGVGNRAEHNYIHDAPHCGLMYTGNNHLIEYNRFERVTQETSDAAAVYAGRDWGFRGNIIRYNYFQDIVSIFGDTNGVYLDDGLSGITVFGNIFHTVKGYGVLSGGGRDNKITNNIFVNIEKAALKTDNRGRDMINNKFDQSGRPDSWNLPGRLKVNYENYFLTKEPINYNGGVWASSYPELAAIPYNYNQIVNEGHWLDPEGCVFGENITWRTDHLMFIGSIAEGGTDINSLFSRTQNNLENVNPLFVGEGSGNLNLKPGSPAFGLDGFEAIPFDKIGIEMH